MTSTTVSAARADRSRTRSRAGSPSRAAGSLGAGVLHALHSGEAHPAMHPGGVAAITGAASGIGLAAARAFAELGMRVALADSNEEALRKAAEALGEEFGAQNVLALRTDVSRLEDVQAFRDRVLEWGGEVSVLLNNAGVGPRSGSWTGLDAWKTIMDVNLWGVVNVQHTFVPQMMCQENPCVIINTGSKQGITNPPGNAAYNASKAAVKSLTESLAHELRAGDSRLSAHLFIPGWTHTGIGGGDAARPKPPGAWTAEQTVHYMIERVRRGEFYVLCPDNETSGTLDRLRVRWAAEDLIEGRPALSRWDPEYKPLFEEYVRAGLVSEQ